MLDAMVWLVALVLAAPFTLLAVESIAALRARGPEPGRKAPRTAVLIPAHDEALEIERTVQAVRRDLDAGDRVVVVADNSTDATAELAAAQGAEVVTRYDPLHRGKGYALEAGTRHLAHDPPEVVVVVDADCRPEPGAVRRVAGRAHGEDRPIQGASLVRPAGAGLLSMVSALAFHLRNEVRPRGLENLGLPVLLQGTGMAIPWHQIERSPLGDSHLAEDRKLGITLAIDGSSPRFEPGARFWSALESNASVSGEQRSRWEQGHLAALREDVPRLLRLAWRDRRAELAALAAELAVPPLALLLGAWGATTLLALASGAGPAPLIALALPAAVSFGLLAWASHRSGSAPVPSRYLLAVPVYALAKAPLYARTALGRQVRWVRGRRGPSMAVPCEAANETADRASHSANSH
jgi:cellulose synthase/poly-beta-1,6-N-acetylglucosamine synthase-like glycosyltransferase